MTNPTESIIKEADKWVDTLSEENKMTEFEEVISGDVVIDAGDEDDEDDCEDEEKGEKNKIKLIKTPNFTDCASANTQLPINLANEAISILSKYRSEFDFVDFIKEKLNYSSRVAVCKVFFSEQIDALVLAIKQFESNKGLILGDMAGIGKGRVVAGLLRYAYQQKIIPVFVTEKENLYSEMYKDILDIDGFGGGGGNIIEPRPFVMNPLKKSSIEVKDEQGNVVLNADGKAKRVSIPTNTLKNDLDMEYETTQPLRATELNEILAESAQNGNIFPFTKKGKAYKFNCVFLTYSVISQTRGESGNNKRYFLLEIAKNSIFVLDECHNASGRSKLGEWAKKYVTEAKGVMFSSATYAKNPQSYPLYIIKTAMAESQVKLEDIESAIGVGGENVSEYISSVLVKEGQMIRRERDFSGCTLGTIYDGYDKQPQETEEIKQKTYKLFNDSVNQFREIYNYIKQKSFKKAVVEAIYKKAEEEELELAPQDIYDDVKLGGTEAKEDERRNFISTYRNKWVIHKFEANTLGKTTKFHFTENLLLAIKSKLVADSVIKELQTQVSYNNIDGEAQFTNRKPVIALRATGENLFKRMNIKTGDLINNDFSEYIKSVVSGVRQGTVTFRKVDANLFVPKYVLEEEGKEHKEERHYYQIDNEDLEDNGEVLDRLLREVNELKTDMGGGEPIPLSPIDYLIDKIQAVQRKSWDLKYKYTSSLNYVVSEVTGRNYALKKQKSGKWMLVTNERLRSVKSAFVQFNNGKSDVIILNSSGSTGGSIHSNAKFIDKRQRMMFITQVELNINTEVQKRGRINRSGQVNYPAYLYVLSQIPSEIRKYLSLAKKLRKLDANVAANQTQNSNLVTIKDKRGKKIKDFFNIYGEEAFERFLNNTDNSEFRSIFDAMLNNFATDAYGDVWVQDGLKKNDYLEPYTRELEIYPCDMQEDFYDNMNMLYCVIVKEHKQKDTFNLQLEIQDYKARLRTRFVRAINNGTTEFSKPLFVEDKYCSGKKFWDKDKVDTEIARMANNWYKKNRPQDSYTTATNFSYHLIEDFENSYAAFIEQQKEKYIEDKKPVRNLFSSEEDYNNELTLYNQGLDELENTLTSNRSKIRELLEFYVPDKPIMFKSLSVAESQSNQQTYNKAKFVGYSFKSTSQYNKYSKGSIYFRFAFLDGSNPTLELCLSKPDHEVCIYDSKRHSESTFTQRDRYSETSYGLELEKTIQKWEKVRAGRTIIRFLSGNILSAIQVANNMGEISRWSLVKYTNEDGSISTSVKLEYPSGEFEPLTDTPTGATTQSDSLNSRATISVALNNPNIVDFLKQVPIDYVFYVSVNTLKSKNVDAVSSSAKNENVEGLIKIKKKNDLNNLYIEIFQATPKKTRNAENNARIDANIPFLNGSGTNNPIYFAPFLSRFTINEIKIYNKDTNPYTLYVPNIRNYSGNSKIFRFKEIDTDDGALLLTNFLKELYEEQQISLEFPQILEGYYNLPYQADILPKAKDEEKKTADTFDEGEYTYKLEVRFDDAYQQSKPPSFVRHIAGSSVFDDGKIILSQPIIPTYAETYKIYPIDLSNENTIKLLFSIMDGEQRAEFISKLKDMVAQDKSTREIGDYVFEVAKRNSVPELRYLFGEKRVLQVGELFKIYATESENKDFDIDLIEFEVEEEQPQKVRVKKKTLESPTAYQDVDKFLNILLF